MGCVPGPVLQFFLAMEENLPEGPWRKDQRRGEGGREGWGRKGWSPNGVHVHWLWIWDSRGPMHPGVGKAVAKRAKGAWCIRR